MIHIKTKQDRARSAAQRFYNQYQYRIDNDLSFPTWAESPKTMYERLLAFGDNITPENVLAVLHPSWLELKCDYCKKDQDKIIVFEITYEFDPDEVYSSDQYCFDCLHEGMVEYMHHEEKYE